MTPAVEASTNTGSFSSHFVSAQAGPSTARYEGLGGGLFGYDQYYD